MELVLILARELASSLATATFLVDPEGTLVYYNEPAEDLLGRPYAESGSMPPKDWGATWHPEDPETGETVPFEALPLGRALLEKRAAHRELRISGLDGVKRNIEVTAFPLFSQADVFVGAVAIFWERNFS